MEAWLEFSSLCLTRYSREANRNVAICIMHVITASRVAGGPLPGSMVRYGTRLDLKHGQQMQFHRPSLLKP